MLGLVGHSIHMVDPNLIYLGLLFGLWLGVTAIYIPGTGLIEGVSVLALIGVAVVLSNMPTNWPAVVVLVVGMLSFVTMPFVKRQYTALAIAGLALQAVGGLFMFTGELAVSPVIVAITIGLSLAYHQFALMPVLARLARQEAISAEEASLVGLRGRVVKALNPIGTVYVRGETWSATSEEPLEPGTDVIVIEQSGLQIEVESIKHKRRENTFEEFPNGH